MVGDEYIQAEILQQELEDSGVEVLGPVPSVAAALALLAAGTPVDAAILDVGLGGEMVFPVAEALRDPLSLRWSALEHGLRAKEDGSDVEQEAQA